MAQRLIFEVGYDTKIFIERLIDFKYYSGFSVIQKQKSICSLHESVRTIYGSENQILEISSKSTQELGRMLSAFNLSINYKGKVVYLENIFQSSKVFSNGGPFVDLLYVSPIQAKKDDRLKQSGELVGFKFNNKEYPIEPKTLFYDWIYCQTLNTKKEYLKDIQNYSIFSDIEFNHEKSFNCQARSAAIFVSLYKKKLLEDALKSIDKFSNIVYGINPKDFNNFE